MIPSNKNDLSESDWVLKLCSFAILICISISSFAQPAFGSSTILDSNNRFGKLSNGFSYYISNTGDDGQKISMTFIARAGFAQQAKDEMQIAHLLEHLAFKSSSELGDIRDKFQGMGLQLGRDINASTSRDYASYDLTVSNNNMLQEGLHFFADCAENLVFKSETVETEREIVLSEIRTRDSGILAELRRAYIRELTVDTVMTRVTDLEKAVLDLNSFNDKMVLNFYKKWYTPANEGLIIVGKIDLDSIEHLVIKEFSKLKDSTEAVKFNRGISPKSKRNLLVIPHGELKEGEIIVYFPVPEISIDDFTSRNSFQLISSMLRGRFESLLQNDAGTLERISVSYQERGQEGFPAFVISIKPHLFYFKSCIKMLLSEINRIKVDGFKLDEFNFYLKFLCSQRQGVSTSVSEVKEFYERYFTMNLIPPSPIITWKNEIHSILKINYSDVNDLFNGIFREPNSTFVILTPSRMLSQIPKEGDTKKWSDSIAVFKPVEYEFNSKKNENIFELDSVENKGLRIASRLFYKELNLTEVEFENSPRVLLRPTMEPNDGRLNLHIIKPQKNELSTEKFILPSLACQAIANSPVNEFTHLDIKRIFELKKISFEPYISASGDGIRSNFEKADLIQILALVNFYFSNAKVDSSALRRVITNYLISHTQLKAEDQLIHDTISSFVYLKDDTISTKEILELKSETATGIFRRHFKDINQYVFILTGSFDVEETLEILLWSLQKSEFLHISNNEIGLNVLPENPNWNQKIIRGFYSGEDTKKADVEIYFSDKYNFDVFNNARLDILKESLRYMLNKNLREMEGGTYEVNCGLSKRLASIPNNGKFIYSISFDCAPSNVQEMIRRVGGTIRFLKHKVLRKTEFEIIKNRMISQVQENMENRNFWVRYLSGQYADLKPFSEILQYNDFISKTSPRNIRTSAKKFIKEKNKKIFFILPASVNSSDLQ